MAENPYVTPVNDLYRRGLPGIKDYPDLQGQLSQMAKAGGPGVEFDKDAANYKRRAQLALIDQIQKSQGGPSIAMMQGQGALGQNAQQALQAAATGQRGVLGQARGIASNIVGDTGSASLKEYLQRNALAANTIGDTRTADLNMAAKYANLVNQQMVQDELRRQAAARIGQGAYGSQADLAREIDKLNMRRLIESSRSFDRTGEGIVQAVGTVAKLAAG